MLYLQRDTATHIALPLPAVSLRYYYNALRPDAPHSIWWQSTTGTPLARQSPEVVRGFLLAGYRDKSRTDELIEAIHRIQQLLLR